jgi:hypothetical protein
MSDKQQNINTSAGLGKEKAGMAKQKKAQRFTVGPKRGEIKSVLQT